MYQLCKGAIGEIAHHREVALRRHRAAHTCAVVPGCSLDKWDQPAVLERNREPRRRIIRAVYILKYIQFNMYIYILLQHSANQAHDVYVYLCVHASHWDWLDTNCHVSSNLFSTHWFRRLQEPSLQPKCIRSNQPYLVWMRLRQGVIAVQGVVSLTNQQTASGCIRIFLIQSSTLLYYIVVSWS